MLDPLRELSAGGPVMLPVVLASIAAWWLALSTAARCRGLDRELTGARLDVVASAAARVAQRLRVLAAIVGVLPLLGLLGTVSGMIATFAVIRREGVGNPRLLAGGIREALIATEAGLAAALPALLFHQLIAARLRRVEATAERARHRASLACRRHAAARTRGER
ncbi:MAG: MotA/TolQ/ExbB proton channel family protein [Planctomycetota bacterium]